MGILPKKDKGVGEWLGGALQGDFRTTKTDWAAVAKGTAAVTIAVGTVVTAAKAAEAAEQMTRATTTAAYQRGKAKK